MSPKKLLKPAAVSSRRSFGALADGVPQARDWTTPNEKT